MYFLSFLIKYTQIKNKIDDDMILCVYILLRPLSTGYSDVTSPVPVTARHAVGRLDLLQDGRLVVVWSVHLLSILSNGCCRRLASAR